MSQFLERLKNQPKPDYEWLSARIRPPEEAPTSNIKVRLDGFFSPSYAGAYMAAWQELLPKAKELAIPILYLQRHALELTIKDLIQSCLGIRDAMHLACDVFGLPGPDAPETDARVIEGHKFRELFSSLRRNLEILKLPSLPDEYQKARELLEDVEDGDETRLRYHTLRKARGLSFSYDSKKPKIADIGQIAKLLTTIQLEHEHFGPDPRDEAVSFIDHLAHRSIGVHDDIMFKLQDLEKRTNEGKVVWRLESTKGMSVADDYPDLDVLKAGGVASTCFVTQFEERRLVILYVPGYSESDPHVLACLRDGKLSRLLWPPPYESNIISAAIDSVKKHTPHTFDDTAG